MAQDVRDVTATSKPRGSYLDPLKACALSGENGVPAGKSETATFTKYSSIIKQTRRNASRASILNDVERSRFDSIVKQMESEHSYHTAILDRQKRQFRKSLAVLEKDRRAVKRYYDKGGKWVATPMQLIDGDIKVKRKEMGDKHLALPPIDALVAVQEANAVEVKDVPVPLDDEKKLEKQNISVEPSTERPKPDMDFAKQVPDFPSRRIQSMPALPNKVPGFLASNIPNPPRRFYTGDDMKTLKGHLNSDGPANDNDDKLYHADTSASI